MARRVLDTEQAVAWVARRRRGRLCADSRRLRPGDVFFAWPGHKSDARAHVPQALAAGAAACLVEADGAPDSVFDDERVAAVRGLKAAAGPIASAVLDHPSRRLELVAVTGTNGKTSSAWWTAQALAQLGRGCGLLGTLGVGRFDASAAHAATAPRLPTLEDTGLTTPDALQLQHALQDFVDNGCRAAALEASSIGLEEHRLEGTRLQVAVFTNFTRDHLDYHGSMQAYWAAKRRLFDWPGLRAAVVNIDDEQGAALAAELSGAPLDLWTVSARGSARLRASQARIVEGGLAFELHEGAARCAVASRLVGDFNVHNLLGVIGALRALGLPLADSAAVVPCLTPVPGRMQRVSLSPDQEAGQASTELPEVIVDYAHTPDALEKALLTLRPLAASRGGELWCVFGCGGNRDATKRPMMGAIAARLARHVVLTSDNPRDESPASIIAAVLSGMRDAPGAAETAVVEDRREAIARTVARAGAADVILVAGKGHEAWQEVHGLKRPFSDVEEAAVALRRRQAKVPQGAAA